MYGLSLPHLMILALVVLVLFGRGRVSATMGDFGKGVREFRRGMSGSDDRQLTARQSSEVTPDGRHGTETTNS